MAAKKPIHSNRIFALGTASLVACLLPILVFADPSPCPTDTDTKIKPATLDSMIQSTQTIFETDTQINPLSGMSREDIEFHLAQCGKTLGAVRMRSPDGPPDEPAVPNLESKLEPKPKIDFKIRADLGSLSAPKLFSPFRDCPDFLNAYWTRQANSLSVSLSSPRLMDFESRKFDLSLVPSQKSDERDPAIDFESVRSQINDWDLLSGVKSFAMKSSRFLIHALSQYSREGPRKVIFQVDNGDGGLRFRWWDKSKNRSYLEVTASTNKLMFTVPVTWDRRARKKNKESD